MARLSADELRALTAKVGLAGEAQRIAVAVALAESGGDTNAVGDGGDSIGLWQINTRFHRYDKGALRDPEQNARAMLAISAGGSNWRPWSVYTNGKYRQYLDQAGSLTPVVGDAVGAVGDAVGGAVNMAASVGKFLGVLSDPSWWKRLGVGAAGFLLIAIVAFLLLKDLATSTVSKAVKGVASRG